MDSPKRVNLGGNSVLMEQGGGGKSRGIGSWNLLRSRGHPHETCCADVTELRSSGPNQPKALHQVPTSPLHRRRLPLMTSVQSFSTASSGQ